MNFSFAFRIGDSASACLRDNLSIYYLFLSLSNFLINPSSFLRSSSFLSIFLSSLLTSDLPVPSPTRTRGRGRGPLHECKRMSDLIEPQRPGPRHLSHIPAEMLRQIAEHVDTKTAASLARTCKSLRNAGELESMGDARVDFALKP